MQRYFAFRVKLVIVFLSLITLFGISATSSSVLNSYSPGLRRYPYLTDAVATYATINWATDRSDSSGGVSYGKVGSEACTAHYVNGSKTPLSVNGVLEYQWKAQLNLLPGTQYCYRVYLGTSPVSQIDLLGGDPAPSFWSQVPSGGNQPFSFVVFGDWGMVDSSGANPYQANLMSLIASSGARFVVTTGDNGYPDGNQKNLGDLIQIGQDISAVFGPSFWKVPGASLPIFPILGNHGYSSPDTNHPALITWPQNRAVSLSQGRYLKETYCCVDGTTSKTYPSAWYAFDAGAARFYILNAAWEEVNIGTASEYQVDYDYHWAPGTDQYEWLRADLQNHPSALKFAFLHYPLYSDNPIESTDTFLLGSNSLEGLFKQYDVDLAFTGHAHIYERNHASASGIPNYITGGGGAELGTIGSCTSLDAYAIKFTTTGKACGSAPLPTSAAQIYHFLKVTVNGTSVNVTPINSLGQAFDVVNYAFTNDSESTPPTAPTNPEARAASGSQINLSWSASTDNTRVRGYGIYRNGVLVNTVGSATFSYSDKNLDPSTTYVYRVDAFDPSGNHSGLSAPRSATTQSTGTYTFEPVADAYVAGDFATTNFGTSAVLKADTTPALQSYLRFNVGNISGTITRATLRLYTTSSSAAGYQVKRVTDQTWEEGKIRYANAPSLGSLIGSSGNFSAGTWVSVDVTSHITGNGIYDLGLTTTSAAIINFNSREAISNQPQLVIHTDTGTTELTFADVPAGYWAESYIEMLYAAGITEGCGISPLIYCPTAPVTRAQMAVFLLRAKHGSNYSPPAASGVMFHDVSSAYWAATWIEQLAKEGITQGCGSANYCPETIVTRDQMAVFLLRAKHGSSYVPPAASGTMFADVPVSYWAAAWIEQLVKEGITAGCGNGTYCPASSVTRDQMAVFLVRTFNLP